MAAGLVRRRLGSQRLGRRTAWRDAADVVAWFGAVQAQEVGPARWGLGQRMVGSTRDADVARALDEGRILRTHVLRPTWHFVAPEDLPWMVRLSGPRILRGMGGRHRQLGLDAETCVRATACFERALAGGHHLTRRELGARLADIGIDARSGPRLAHLSMVAELEGVICSGPQRGREPTYALLAERAPGGRALAGEEAVAELVLRYYQSHGPATLRDFAWWSGLTMADARRGLEMHRAASAIAGGLTYWWIGDGGAVRSTSEAEVHLLPVYDEYVVAYRDRTLVPHGPSRPGADATVIFQHALIIDGHVAGTWKVRRRDDAIAVDVTAMRRLRRAERDAVRAAEKRYGRFVGAGVEVSID
jgi:hypothetical protein